MEAGEDSPARPDERRLTDSWGMSKRGGLGFRCDDRTAEGFGAGFNGTFQMVAKNPNGKADRTHDHAHSVRIGQGRTRVAVAAAET